MQLSLLSRYATLVICLLIAALTLPLLQQWIWLWPLTLFAGALSVVGIRDLLQREHSVRRNYPILGHIRYFVEFIRPEIRQYLLEADDEKLPFARSQRSLVY